MIQTILNIALLVAAGVLAWKLRKEIKSSREIKEDVRDYRKWRETLNDPEATFIPCIAYLPDRNMYVVGIRAWGNRYSTTAIVKTFPYDPNDASDRDYALRCAEELKEAIEYDWRIKTDKYEQTDN